MTQEIKYPEQAGSERVREIQAADFCNGTVQVTPQQPHYLRAEGAVVE
jgi:hypothetical protein